ncbi:hypothetical protein [Acidiferrobacter sp.]|jgi:hypothetical protein|uniref:hypothetical protein n=1 Tax=Acidiferrobacter sp. TaxID=1872107 RepID=UPI00262963F1|nr:hypothetical protein [Acidiferrobacter sp.]
MTIQNRAARLAARVAPYQEAVDAGRRAGLTWGDLGQIFGVSARALAAACKRARRYEVAQLPLPDPAPAATPTAARAAPGPKAAALTSGTPEAAPAPAASGATPADTAPPAPTPARRVSAREALAAARQYNYPTRK